MPPSGWRSLQQPPAPLPTDILYSTQFPLTLKNQDGSLSNSTICCYDVTEKYRTVNSLPWPRLKPGPLDLEAKTLIGWLLHSPQCACQDNQNRGVWTSCFPYHFLLVAALFLASLSYYFCKSVTSFFSISPGSYLLENPASCPLFSRLLDPSCHLLSWAPTPLACPPALSLDLVLINFALCYGLTIVLDKYPCSIYGSRLLTICLLFTLWIYTV